MSGKNKLRGKHSIKQDSDDESPKETLKTEKIEEEDIEIKGTKELKTSKEKESKEKMVKKNKSDKKEKKDEKSSDEDEKKEKNEKVGKEGDDKKSIEPKSITEFNHDEISVIDKKNFEKFDDFTLLKVLVVRGHKNHNPTMQFGTMRLMRQLNGEFETNAIDGRPNRPRQFRPNFNQGNPERSFNNFNNFNNRERQNEDGGMENASGFNNRGFQQRRGGFGSGSGRGFPNRGGYNNRGGFHQNQMRPGGRFDNFREAEQIENPETIEKSISPSKLDFQ